MITVPYTDIDWLDRACQLSEHFTVKEALYLPTWGRLANESDGLTDNLKAALHGFFNNSMDVVRNWIALPINVHVAYRPPAYNALIGGAKASAHMDGIACDFDVADLPCSTAISEILGQNMLQGWGLRMENNSRLGPMTWIHLDSREPSPNRYFVP